MIAMAQDHHDVSSMLADLHERFMRSSIAAIAESKRTVRLLPNRRLKHLLSFQKLIRPIEMSLAASYATSMRSSGFRVDEPVTVSEEIPVEISNKKSLTIPMSIIGGDHRCCASRMSGMSVVTAYITPYTSLRDLYDIIQKMDDIQGKNATAFDRWHRVLRKLTVPCQVREPAPHATLVLEQVAMIRTFCEDTFKPSFDVNRNIFLVTQPNYEGGFSTPTRTKTSEWMTQIIRTSC